MTDPTASAARDDLAFVRSLVSDSGQVAASTGVSLFGGGLCYGVQAIAQGLLLQFPAGFPGRNWAQLIFAVLPTVVFMVLITRITVRDVRNKPSAGGGVASRAFRTAFSAAGLSITVTATVFGYVAITEHNMTIWLFHPIMVCVALGVGWYMAYAIRRRPWFAVVSGGWFVCALVLTPLLHLMAAYILVLGVALFALMALPGWLLWRTARAGG
jgi:hypothetical protein